MKNAPKIHLIGNAHLDPIWLWRWQEGCGEVLQTFRSAVDRLNEYKGFIFTCSSAAYYKWVEEIDPGLFEEICEKVRQGRWVPVNGWWVQPDCNMPSGESFARQALYSQLYYYEKFGKICQTGYNVDSFGHSAFLPQLLSQAGMCNYCFQRPSLDENPDIPDIFIWKSQDGSKVLTYHLTHGYGCSENGDLREAMEEADRRVDKHGHSMMMFYGIGNHGGGPTRGDLEYLIDSLKKDGHHELCFSDPDAYFAALRLEMPDLPVWQGDLQHHASGCYSATSLVKQLNRQAENSVYAAEAFSTAAYKTCGMKSAREKIKEAWLEICFNQFHDVMCGCSIAEAYEDVRNSFGQAMNISAKVYNEAVLRIAKKIDTWVDGVSEPVCAVRNQLGGDFRRPFVVFNPLSYDIEVPVRAYQPSKEVFDSEGRRVIFQNVRSSRSNDTHLDTCFIAKIPALGYSTYWLRLLREGEDSGKVSLVPSSLSADGLKIENDYMRVVFSEKTGFIISLVNKQSGFDYASCEKPVAVPTVINDDKTDTWAHNVFTFHDIKGVMELESIKLVESGPARAVVRVKHRFGESHLTQDFILGCCSKTLRVKCKAFWQEQFTLLKMSFPVSGEMPENTYDIPAGYIKRPANGEEEPAGKWGAISVVTDGKKRSLALINDSKYSYDSVGCDFRLTLMRNVIFADHYSHRPPADFNFTDEGKQTFEYGIFTADGDIEKTDIMHEAFAFNIRPAVVPESYHKGSEKQVKSFIYCDRKNIIMTAFKLCEDNSGAAAARFYEVSGTETRAAFRCDMFDCAFRADFGANEIKTFRIEPDGRVYEENFLEGIVK